MARKPTNISTEEAVSRLRKVTGIIIDTLKGHSGRIDDHDGAIETLQQEVEGIKNNLPFSVKDFDDLEKAANQIK